MITFLYVLLVILCLVILGCLIYFGYDVFKIFIKDMKSACMTKNWDTICGYGVFISIFLVLIILKILSQTGNL